MQNKVDEENHEMCAMCQKQKVASYTITMDEKKRSPSLMRTEKLHGMLKEEAKQFAGKKKADDKQR
jgi:hypothetical protein